MKARFIDLIEDAHEGVTTLLGEHPEQKVGKNRHQGSLGDVVTYMSYAPKIVTDELDGVFDSYIQRAKSEGFELGKAITYCNCLKTISILGATVGCGLLAKDIFEAVKFAINEQNKTDDHCEDGDQKE